MLTADRIQVHLHDDTVIHPPRGSRYTLDSAGVRVVAPSGAALSWPAWEVLRVDSSTPPPKPCTHSRDAVT